MAFSLYVCVYWPEIFCLKAVALSARMYVLAFQDQHTLPKEKYSLSAGLRASNYTEYFTLGGCAGPGRPIHTYEQREQQL